MASWEVTVLQAPAYSYKDRDAVYRNIQHLLFAVLHEYAWKCRNQELPDWAREYVEVIDSQCLVPEAEGQDKQQRK